MSSVNQKKHQTAKSLEKRSRKTVAMVFMDGYLAGFVVFLVLQNIASACRLYVRLVMIRNFGLDDVVFLIALVSIGR